MAPSAPTIYVCPLGNRAIQVISSFSAKVQLLQQRLLRFLSRQNSDLNWGRATIIMLQPRQASPLITALRNFSKPSFHPLTQARTQTPRVVPICMISSARYLGTGARAICGIRTSTLTSRQWSTGPLGNADRRPSLEAMGTKELIASRGMKVRSSVKKLCEGCKVGRAFPRSRLFAGRLIVVL